MKKDDDEKWLSPREHYINSFLTHQFKHCPECGGEIKYSSEDEYDAYCPECGLITSGNYPYVAGIRIEFPYGLRL